MKINIICVGKIKEAFFRDAINEYTKRISKFSTVNIIELPDEKTSENASLREIELVLNKEGERILNSIRSEDFVISLCIEGKKLSSTDFSNKISDIMVKGNNTIDLIIGGSLGLSEQVKSRSDFKLSFSDMTFPHQLMRVILLEQVYRAFKIMHNEPYHK